MQPEFVKAVSMSGGQDEDITVLTYVKKDTPLPLALGHFNALVTRLVVRVPHSALERLAVVARSEKQTLDLTAEGQRKINVFL